MKKQSQTARTETHDQPKHTATKLKPPAPTVEQILIRQRAAELYAARQWMIGMTPNDWLKAEQELKREHEKRITNK